MRNRLDRTMTDRTVVTSPQVYARVAGLLYLIVIVAGVFAEIIVRDQLVVPNDAAATAHNIMTHELQYRLGFAAELIALVCNIPLAIIFYELFKVVNRQVTLLVVFYCLVGTAIEGVALLNHLAPLTLLSGGRYLSVIPAAQLQAQVYLSLKLYELGFAICLVFFGFYCVSLGYLMFRSSFLHGSSARCWRSKASVTSSIVSQSFSRRSSPSSPSPFSPSPPSVKYRCACGSSSWA